MESQHAWKQPWRGAAHACLMALPLWVALIVGCCAVFGCASTPWAKLDVAGDEIVAGIDRQIMLRHDKPSQVSTLEDVRKVAVAVDETITAMAAGNPPPEGWDAALKAATAAVDATIAGLGADDQDLRAALDAVRTGLGLIRIMAA